MVVRQFPGRRSSVRASAGRRRRGPSKWLGLCGVVVALGVCLACLTGCRIDAKVEFKADGGQYTEIVFEDTTDSMRTLKGNCEELREYFGTTARYAAAAKMEDVTAPGGHLRCRATSNVPHDEVTVKDNGDTLSISMKSSPPDGGDLDGLTMTTTITMPGKVIKSSIGKVHGNKVVIDGYDYPITGFTITSRKNNSASPATGPTARQPTTGTATPTSRHGAHAGSSPWVWTGVGCTTLAALTLGGLTTFRSTRKKNNTPHKPQTARGRRPSQRDHPTAPTGQGDNATDADGHPSAFLADAYFLASTD